MPSMLTKVKEQAQKSTPKRALQFVSAQAPYPMMVISFDYTFDDLAFATGEVGDPAGKPPVMFVPMFVHVKKDFATYHFLTSTLVGQRRELASLQAFGTDGEQALEGALAATFTNAQHVRCFLHFKGNVERKLRELHLPMAISNEIVKDTMGCPSQLQHGVVDAENAKQLDEMLAKLESRWNELERPYNSPPFFHTWFLKHCRDNVARFMVQDCREKAGLGSLPSPYYTNEVESKNKILKCEVQYKSSQLPDFVDKMRSVMEEQEREIERAVVNTREYRLRKESRHLSVESSKWFKLTSDQRKRKINQIMKATVVFDVPSTSQSSESTLCPLDGLPIPFYLKPALWEKANELADDKSAIVQATGDEQEWMVKSYSGKAHHVRKSKNSIACEDRCISYKSMKICSHTVALALRTECLSTYLKYFGTTKQLPNFTSLAEAGRTTSAGKKPSQKGVSRKCSRQIQTIVTSAEEAGVQWENRAYPVTPYEPEDFGPEHGSPTPSEPFSSGMMTLPTNTVMPLPTSSPTKYFVSNRDVHIGSIGASGTCIPPPLIPTNSGRPYTVPQNSGIPSSIQLAHHSLPSPVQRPSIPPPRSLFLPSTTQRPRVETPFWVAFIFGNVSRCNGCKGRIMRGENKKVLPPPDDLVMGHKEYVVYQNSQSGLYEES